MIKTASFVFVMAAVGFRRRHLFRFQATEGPGDRVAPPGRLAFHEGLLGLRCGAGFIAGLSTVGKMLAVRQLPFAGSSTHHPGAWMAHFGGLLDR